MDINYSYFNTAKGYKVVGGTAAQFLKADGSVDSNNYLSQTVANSNFATIQNIGGAAKRTVCINTPQYSTTGVHRIYLGISGLTGYLKVKITSIYAGSNLAGFIELAGGVGANGGSFHFNTLRCAVSNGNVRSGYYIDPVLKYDSVTGFIYIEIHKKTAPSNLVYVEVESNSAYILTNPIVLSQTFDATTAPSNLTNEVDVQGSITSQSFIKTGGTAAQFLKADGSIDTNSYVTNNFVGNGYGGINTRMHPTDYTYWGNPTGAIVIILPAEFTYQDNFDIDIVDTQWANLHQKLQINTYGSLAYSKAVLVNDTGAPDVVTRLRVGKLPDNRSCLIINDVNTAWSYPQMVVNKYVGGSLTIAKGAWTTQLLTDLSSITIQQEVSIIKAVNSAITSNTTQTGLTGDKITAGSWVFNGAAANSLTILRPGNTINNSIAMGFNAASLYFGLADSNVFAIGNNPNLALPNRFFWLDQNLFSANLQGQVGGSTLIARDRGGFSIATTTNTSRAEMILRHNWTANNQTFGIGGTGATASGSMASWGMQKWLNNRTVNGNDGFFGWEGDTDVLRATALSGTGIRMVVATASGVLQTQTIPTTDLSNYYTKNESLNLFVGVNNVQDIGGAKTFLNSPIVPWATLASQAINLGQVDDMIEGLASIYIPRLFMGQANGVATLNTLGFIQQTQMQQATADLWGVVKFHNNVSISGTLSPSVEVAGRMYPVQKNNSGVMAVTVPWTDTLYIHPNSGATAGTYRSVTVNAQGHVTAGTNPTTLAGYQISDAMSTSHTANGITSNLIGNWNTAYGWGDYRQYGFGRTVEAPTNYDINTVANTSILGINDNTSNRPFDFGSVWTHRKGANDFTQIAVNEQNGDSYTRAINSSFGDTGWKRNWNNLDFTYADINNWGNIAVYGIKKNVEFSSYTGTGLMLADDYIGGEAGLFDAVLERMVAGKEDGFYKYGSQYNYSGGLLIEIATGRMGYGGVMPSPSHNHYFNGAIRITEGIYSESSNGNDIYAGSGSFYYLDEEIKQEDKVIRLVPFDKVFSGTNNTFGTKNRVVKITLNDGGMIIMDEFFVNQEITIMNISSDYATFAVNNTPIKVKIDPRSSATFYVNSDNRMVMVRMDNDYCRILG